MSCHCFGCVSHSHVSGYRTLPHVASAVLACFVNQKYGEVQTAEFWCLGLGEPWPISGLHGDGVSNVFARVAGACAVLLMGPFSVRAHHSTDSSCSVKFMSR